MSTLHQSRRSEEPSWEPDSADGSGLQRADAAMPSSSGTPERLSLDCAARLVATSDQNLGFESLRVRHHRLRRQMAPESTVANAHQPA